MEGFKASAVSVLREQFGLGSVELFPQEGGWSAYAFRVEAGMVRYFLKVYAKNRTSTARLIAPARFYLPLSRWLHDEAGLAGKIANPVAAMDGGFIAEDEAGYYLLFDYIEGITVGEGELSAGQMEELGEIVGRLHRVTPSSPLPPGGVYEDYSLPFVGLADYLAQDLGAASEDIRSAILPHLAVIGEMIDRVEALAGWAMSEDHNYVLCHTDIHNWNLMASGHLVLVDMENLKLAPPEHDLYMMLGKPYLEAFWRAYRRYHPEYQINGRLVEFYTAQRELEDLWEWIKQLTYDQPEPETRARALHWLQRNVDALVQMAAQ